MAAPLTPYELERLTKMEANRQFLESLGVDDAVRKLDRAMSTSRVPRRNPGPRKVAAPAPIRPTRRSSRVGGKNVVVYKELSEQDVRLIDGPEPKKGGRRKRASAEQPVRASYGPELYTDEHEDALGECQEEWVLFQDGYTEEGTRVYDTVQGKTCHQCRQKTLGKRTWCNGCESLNGQFCGDCLYMRYGENILEVNANPEWNCPSCRDLCNCSICRNRKGWGPTGQLYRTALDQGYKSVAHYLVATRRALPTTPSALKPSAVAPPVASTEHFADVIPKPSPSSPASVITDVETNFVGGKIGSQKDGDSSPPMSDVSDEVFFLDCPSPESVNAESSAGGSDTVNTRFTHIAQFGQKRNMELGSPGGSSCESGLSSEMATGGKGEILERKFRSLEEITGGGRPVKKRRGARARSSCSRFVDFV
ncbi:hypothetical protein KFL_002810060 [Klebsormidium nitens]|uniref:Zinc-finger domain-containing protein n=1 Tax=Klebsormidium nitens TaxID=105231 RepID=A0A1Y1IDY8_KLENI|nr:hypothetical protein KFL_002810060 [Klebsormidium nitens]|eukprot:GAQ86298.1 hypothetical protein KFL_002810060 [Klebsormidium nitens]